MKTALIQCADTGPLESLVIMLRAVGYRCVIPGERLKNHLREDLRCDNVTNIADLIRGMGYERPMALDAVDSFSGVDLFVDIKAHRNGPKVWRKYPWLRKRTLWYRINGGEPEHVVNSRGDHGNEVSPPCPVLTPNQWYREAGPWQESGAYCCWPPFYRFDEYYPKYGRPNGSAPKYSPPVCLIHNLKGWGYERLVGAIRALGVRCYGDGSPDGLIRHEHIPQMLSTALAMVHLKSSDAPGYALYEAMAAGCPVVCTRRLIWRCRMQDLFIPYDTCFVFDRETHEGLTPDDVAICTKQVRNALADLSDPAQNKATGMAGRNRLRQLMWDEKDNAQELRSWLERYFPLVYGKEE